MHWIINAVSHLINPEKICLRSIDTHIYHPKLIVPFQSSVAIDIAILQMYHGDYAFMIEIKMHPRIGFAIIHA